jgi:hypothetical protein
LFWNSKYIETQASSNGGTTMPDEKKERDFWDKFGSVSVFMSSVVIATASLVVSSTYNERQSERAAEAQEKQHQLAKVQTLATFMPHLSGDKASREAASFAITALGYPELAVRLNQLRNEGSSTNDSIMRTAPASIVSVPAQAESGVAKESIGWVYLGDYDIGKNKWNTRYLSFDPRLKPENLTGQSYEVRSETGSINLRLGMPTDNGEFPKVIRALKPKDRLYLQDVKQWLTTGYTWARVKYAK